MLERSWWLIVPAVTVVIGTALLVSIALVWVIPWYGLLSGFFVIGLIVVWGAVIYDLLRRADVSWWRTALWAVFLIVLPVISAIAYYITRPAASKVSYKGEQVA